MRIAWVLDLDATRRTLVAAPRWLTTSWCFGPLGVCVCGLGFGWAGFNPVCLGFVSASHAVIAAVGTSVRAIHVQLRWLVGESVGFAMHSSQQENW
jgi:hypothetical protein